ncbi:diphosphomevalonate decarboxylase [Senegalia massiliensis]|jgi:diphosphomevalonate decarboxylase|uniref:diphosphomevalonate decarboxylase n=1 Tax=Senegalia massiliensis TaxID=1720316 RepID=UPI00102F5727|nr:diphosphomevalonate decarboxylase [Senegalia massiliensis]
MKATAKANTNIALIKYWGKRDEKLFLPTNNSISITLDRFYTVTTVEFKKNITNDIFYLNNKKADKKEQIKISSFLDKIRDFSGTNFYAVVNSENKVPTAAGFASSASGFAALAAASIKALGLELDKSELSAIARQGSGSACRSIYGGYVEWEKGERIDGKDSFAKRLLPETDWNISILSVLVNSNNKNISSREGMKRTVETSPFYSAWLDTVEKDLEITRKAIKYKDFESLGEVVEKNALKMHATMLGSEPPILYWQSGTMDVIHHIKSLRLSGISAYFTIDAGANVKVLCNPSDEKKIYESLLKLESVQNVIACHPGKGITYL